MLYMQVCINLMTNLTIGHLYHFYYYCVTVRFNSSLIKWICQIYKENFIYWSGSVKYLCQALFKAYGYRF